MFNLSLCFYCGLASGVLSDVLESLLLVEFVSCLIGTPNSSTKEVDVKLMFCYSVILCTCLEQNSRRGLCGCNFWLINSISH